MEKKYFDKIKKAMVIKFHKAWELNKEFYTSYSVNTTVSRNFISFDMVGHGYRTFGATICCVCVPIEDYHTYQLKECANYIVTQLCDRTLDNIKIGSLSEVSSQSLHNVLFLTLFSNVDRFAEVKNFTTDLLTLEGTEYTSINLSHGIRNYCDFYVFDHELSIKRHNFLLYTLELVKKSMEEITFVLHEFRNK